MTQVYADAGEDVPSWHTPEDFGVQRFCLVTELLLPCC